MAESNQTLDLKEFQLHDKDTGSADVQVALLTHRIEHLTEHLKVNRKDHSSRRGLLKMVAQRRSLLDYLSKTEADRYKKLIEKLEHILRGIAIERTRTQGAGAGFVFDETAVESRQR